MERKAREEGTTSGEMIKDMEHKVGDWRRGKSWREIIEGTKEGGRNGQYLAWRKLREGDITIGEEGEEALTEEAKDLYLRLQ